jgi:hypothetical protein
VSLKLHGAIAAQRSDARYHHGPGNTKVWWSGAIASVTLAAPFANASDRSRHE